MKEALSGDTTSIVVEVTSSGFGFIFTADKNLIIGGITVLTDNINSATKNGAIVCKDCPDGYIQPSMGRPSCHGCGFGKHKVSPTECKDCEIGKISIGTANHVCDRCPAGKYKTSHTVCSDCPHGYYSFGEVNACTIMSVTTCHFGHEFSSASGTFDDLLDLHDYLRSTADDGLCTICPGGKYKANTEIERCLICQPGKHSIISTTTFDDTEYHNNIPYITSEPFQMCLNCALGKYHPKAGVGRNSNNVPTVSTEMSECKECELGRFNSQLGYPKTGCEICPKGRYISITGQSQCLKCPTGRKGYFYLGSRSTSPLLHDSIDDCEPCEVLYYNPFKGLDKCYLCITADVEGSSTCSGCSPGMYTGELYGVWQGGKCEPYDSPEWAITINQATLTLVAGTTVTQTDASGFTYASGTIRDPNNNAATTTIIISATNEQVFDTNADLVIDEKGTRVTVSADDITAASFGVIGEHAFEASNGQLVYARSLDEISCKKSKIWDKVNEQVKTECLECDFGKYTASQSNSECVNCPTGYYGLLRTEGAITNAVTGVNELSFAVALNGDSLGTGTRVIYNDNNQTTISELTDGETYYVLDGTTTSNMKLALTKGGTPINIAAGGGAAGNRIVVYIPFDRCEGCPRGQYGTAPGKKAEEIDPSKPWYVSSGCSQCGTGKYNDQSRVNHESGCKLCSIGQWSGLIGAADSGDCINCNSGKYNNQEGQNNTAVCIKCSSGLYLEAVGSGDQKDCLTCPSGFYGTEKGKAFCLPCLPGTRQPESGNVKCIPCLFGRYSNQVESIATECEKCIKGQYMDAVGSTICLKCAPGKYQNERASTTCKKCAKHTYIGARKADVCDVCPTGWSAKESGQASCQICSVGQFGKNNTQNEKGCHKCPKGFYQKESGQSLCAGCSLGKDFFFD